MKKLTNFKDTNKKEKKKNANASPYLAHETPAETNGTQHSMTSIPPHRTASLTSTQNLAGDNAASFRSSLDGANGHQRGQRSVAPTIATDHGAAKSTAGQSGNTAATGLGAGTTHNADSTFSSPAPSLRSLTTTLTTVHSTSAANALLANGGVTGNNTAHNSMNGAIQGAGSGSVHFSHQFPTSSAPVSAIPGHLAPQGQQSGGHPATYTTATANGILTDNASILTLASSSKRRRRRSMDTDASVRALAPSSLFGGSRESLPLSVLSSNVDIGPAALRERASVYSATGVAPALTSERNSFYNQGAGRGEGSIRSGVFGNREERPMHTREGSIAGSFVGSPLVQQQAGQASPQMESVPAGKGKEIVN